MPSLLHESHVKRFTQTRGFSCGKFARTLCVELARGWGLQTKNSCAHGSCVCKPPSCDDCGGDLLNGPTCPVCGTVATCGYKAAREALFRGGVCPVVPDAWRIDSVNRLVECLEVDVTSALNDRKLLGYIDLWFVLDCESWSLCVHFVDRYGNESRFDDAAWTSQFYALPRDV